VVPTKLEVQVTAAVFAPEHMLWVRVLFVIVGVGLIVITKLAVVPGQLLNVGVTAILEKTVALELFARAVQGLI
jgi:hypothetical protein